MRKPAGSSKSSGSAKRAISSGPVSWPAWRDRSFPGDPEFQELDRLAQQALERRAEAERLLGLGREACAAGRTAEGIETFRRAYDLDSSNSQVRTVLVETLIEQGRVLMESNPGSAEELFNHALELEPNHALATGFAAAGRRSAQGGDN